MENQEKVFVVNEQWSMDCGDDSAQSNLGVYKNIDDAKKKFNSAIEQIKKDWGIDSFDDENPESEWLIEDETDRLFEFQKDDYEYHYTLIIEEHTLS